MSNFDESTISEKNPEKLVSKLSECKAKEVFARVQNQYKDLIVVGGDTIVYFDNKILGKPKDRKDAFRTLKTLQGNTHYVYSGLAVISKKNEKIIEHVDFTKTAVYMKKMTDEEIEKYIETGEPMDKAGSYAIQGIGSKFIEKIEGSYSSVVGLDIEKLEEILNKL